MLFEKLCRMQKRIQETPVKLEFSVSLDNYRLGESNCDAKSEIFNRLFTNFEYLFNNILAAKMPAVFLPVHFLQLLG
jgi:hypothetical protein